MRTDLLKYTGQGGCSAKLPPALLDEFLKVIPPISDPDVLVGISTHDDAGVYRLSEELALVFTTDFFPPLCSDPYDFGQIAAANALSDVYAMGGRPVTALSIMMFPSEGLSHDAFSEILRGGVEKAAEAGVSIIGGHTIEDAVPKFGLAVAGFVHPKAIVTNAALVPGDVLILTKPVGTGTILAASRLGIADESDLGLAIGLMKQLNDKAAGVMRSLGVRAATDVTGFGLGGHALKMARASGTSVNIDMSAVPLIGNVLKYTDSGCIPGTSFRNLAFAENDTSFSGLSDYNLKMIAFDAQTSGGILMAVRREQAELALGMLSEGNNSGGAIIGEVTSLSDKYLYLSG